MNRGYQLTLDFEYQPSRSVEDNTKDIVDYLNENMFTPVKRFTKCSDIEGEFEASGATPYNLLLFHLPRSEDDPTAYNGLGFPYYVMTELAKHEKFVYNWRDLRFYMIEDVQCMHKFGLEPHMDTAVMFLRKDKPDGTSERLPHLANYVDVTDFQRFNRWVNIVINDVERKFTERAVRIIMHEHMFFGVLLRKGGRPETEEDYAELAGEDKQAVEAFDAFAL